MPDAWRGVHEFVSLVCLARHMRPIRDHFPRAGAPGHVHTHAHPKGPRTGRGSAETVASGEVVSRRHDLADAHNAIRTGSRPACAIVSETPLMCGTADVKALIVYPRAPLCAGLRLLYCTWGAGCPSGPSVAARSHLKHAPLPGGHPPAPRALHPRCLRLQPPWRGTRRHWARYFPWGAASWERWAPTRPRC